MKPFKPLLADPVDFDLLDIPNTWLSPKLDGIRAIVINGVVMSRKLLPIPNEHVQSLFGRPELEGYDGELIVGEPYSQTVYNDTYSGVMKKAGTPEVRLFAFDHIGEPQEEYQRRLLRLSRVLPGVEILTQHSIKDMADLLNLEEMYLGMGYEGVMLRRYQGPKSIYKFGRSTAKEGTLLKLKRLEDFEAKIVGYEEEMYNGNEATIDELGNTKRSSHRENKTGKDTLGKLICEYGDLTFKVGIFKGFDAKWKKQMWEERETLPGKWVKLQKLGIGEKDRPRHPRVTAMLGFRHPIDIS